MGQLELAYVPSNGCIIYLDAHGLLDGPGNAVLLPTHYVEIVHNDVMDDLRCYCGHRWGREPEMLLEPIPRSPCSFTYV